MSGILVGLLGSIVTLGIFVAGVIYKMGHHAARLEQLERWRGDIRIDMHEISNNIQELTTQIVNLSTLVAERTNRRIGERDK